VKFHRFVLLQKSALKGVAYSPQGGSTLTHLVHNQLPPSSHCALMS